MSLSEQTDEALMLLVKRGEMDAFTLLVNRYKQGVMNVVARTIGDNQDAEDIAQQVFVQVYRHRDQYQVGTRDGKEVRFSTWLFTIAKNLTLNEIRRRKRHPAESLDGGGEYDEYSGVDGSISTRQQVDPRATSPDIALLNREMLSNLRRAIAELPENQRLALMLFQEKGLAYNEIAQILETSLSSTKSLIFRARETLKKKLNSYLHG